MAKTREYELIGNRKQVILLHDKLFPLYIVKGEKNFLIDSGVTSRAAAFRERIDTALETFGNNKRIDTLLLTHTHWDHVGAAYYLQQVYRFNILGARRAAQLLPKNKVVGFIDRLNQEYKKMMKDDSDTRFGLLENLEAVHEGDTIRVDDQSYLEVIETPGHTKCSVAYLLHPDKILFQGDAAGVLETDGSIKPLFLSSYKEHENSIKKLIAAGAEILAFPHNRFIKGKEKVEEYLQASLARTQRVKEEIIKLLKREPDITKIADTVYRREFPNPSLMGPKEALVINLEAMVKTVKKEFPEE